MEEKDRMGETLLLARGLKVQIYERNTDMLKK